MEKFCRRVQVGFFYQMIRFSDKLSKIVRKNDSLLCVGLDQSSFDFNKNIINQTHDLVCAYKPNSAFYEAEGAKGIEELKRTCDYLRKNHPEIVIILDAKRADIGSTNEGYVKYAFDYLGVDAITIHPYLGSEAIKPFLERTDKGCIILVRTSNPGAGEFQDLKVGEKPLYQIVAEKVSKVWNKNGNCLMVCGATYPEELKNIRKIAPKLWFLVPGIGAQGGDIEKTVKAGLNKNGDGIIVNSSRGIIFAKNPREEALKLKNLINIFRPPSRKATAGQRRT